MKSRSCNNFSITICLIMLHYTWSIVFLLCFAVAPCPHVVYRKSIDANSNLHRFFISLLLSLCSLLLSKNNSHAFVSFKKRLNRGSVTGYCYTTSELSLNTQRYEAWQFCIPTTVSIKIQLHDFYISVLFCFISGVWWLFFNSIEHG